MQNTSHAVMAQRRVQAIDAADNFPTPPWAIRVLGQGRLDPTGIIATVAAFAMVAAVTFGLI